MDVGYLKTYLHECECYCIPSSVTKLDFVILSVAGQTPIFHKIHSTDLQSGF